MPTSDKPPRGRPCCLRALPSAPAAAAPPNRASDALAHILAVSDTPSEDLASLSPTEAAAVYAVLDRAMTELWDAHRRTLFPLFMAALTRRGLALSEEGEDEPADELVDDDEGNQVH